ncbi:MAG: nucleotidyltransferase family protein [Candidatus Natronoplasma sp.]
MTELEEIQEKLKEHKPELEEKYNVEEISIFGSYTRGEQTKESDLDVDDTCHKNKMTSVIKKYK